MRQVITFDCDGVIAGGNYVPRWDRCNDHYLNLPILDPAIPGYLARLSKWVDIYVVSARQFGNALQCTRDWLEAKGVDLRDLAGVIVGTSAPNKVKVVELIGSELHFDDDPAIVEPLGDHGILVNSTAWPANQFSTHPRVDSWPSIVQTIMDRILPIQQTFLFGN